MGCLRSSVSRLCYVFKQSEETQRGAAQPGKGWVRVLSFGLWF